MTERFNVSGALLVKLFGRPDAESKEFARRAGRGPGLRHPAGPAGPVPLRLAVAGRGGRDGRRLLAGRPRGRRGHARASGTVVALAAYVTRLYSPLTDLASAQVDVLGAIVSFDRVFEVLDTAAVGRRPARGADRLTPTVPSQGG